MELRLDLLRVAVRGQLLAAALHQQEQAVVLGVGHFKLVGAQLTHLLHGGVRSDLQGLGRAAAVQLLQRHPQVVLRDGQRKTQSDKHCSSVTHSEHNLWVVL